MNDYYINHQGSTGETTVCRIDNMAPVAKHCPVRISVRADVKHVLTRQITKPVPYPKAAPICCRQVPVIDQALASSVRDTLAEARSLSPQPLQARTRCAHHTWPAAAEPQGEPAQCGMGAVGQRDWNTRRGRPIPLGGGVV